MYLCSCQMVKKRNQRQRQQKRKQNQWQKRRKKLLLLNNLHSRLSKRNPKRRYLHVYIELQINLFNICWNPSSINVVIFRYLVSCQCSSNNALFQFVFNICDRGFTELHNIWREEHFSGNTSIWSRLHDYWSVPKLTSKLNKARLIN